MTGDELRAIRDVLALTQAKLGALMGYETRTIADLERGRKQIADHFEKHLILLAKALELKKLVE